MKAALKRLVARLAGGLGLEVRRKHKRTARASLRGSLEHIRALGCKPAVVIDVGAADGTPELYEVFPESQHILIEPLIEFEPKLKQLVSQKPNLRYIIGAASRQNGEIVLNVHPDLYGSSTYKESDGSAADGVPRTVQTVALDSLAYGPGRTYLLKVDVQGGELDVLAGASQILTAAEYVVLETSLFPFYQGGPQLYDVLNYMHERGFAVYDIFGAGYRPLDGATSQVDVAFVPEKGRLRAHHGWATPEQRTAFARQFSHHLDQLGISK